MIITNNDTLLRTKCGDAKPEEVGELIELLERELDRSAKLGSEGIGLACPQIGIHKNVAIVRIDKQYRIDLINCKIKNAYDPIIFKDEGCLSYPNRIEDTRRHQELHIIDNLAYPHSFIVSGLMSIVIEHELDHLNGILFFDKAIKKSNKKIGPNDPCICGKIDPLTGRFLKFKKCCGRDI
jgi:peptide deformylase